MRGLDPRIHLKKESLQARWIAGSSPAMTTEAGHCLVPLGGHLMLRLPLAAAVLLLAASGELAAQGKGIRFWNLTTATVVNFQLSPAGKDAWGPNQCLNDRDKEVDHDERLRITGIAPGRYDVKVGYRGGRTCCDRAIEIEADAVFSIADKDLRECNK